MTYRGLGSGIPRVLSEDSHVEFIDSKDGNQFTARIFRPVIDEENGSMAVSKAVSKIDLLLDYCSVPRSMSEICKHIGLKDKYKVKKKYIDPLLNTKLTMTEPNSPNSPTQKYVVIKNV